MDDELVERMFEAHPLCLFSVYTHAQVAALRELDRELMGLLDSGISSGVVDGRSFQRAYGLFWLWVVGAYEVTRTMCQAQKCFAPALLGRLHDLKKALSVIRVPFAKQEYRGEHGVPIRNEASVSGIDSAKKDLLFRVGGTTVSVRSLVGEFAAVFDGVSRDDILGSHASEAN